jgi:drug/metabolite transporter (DMT)-like permease
MRLLGVRHPDDRQTHLILLAVGLAVFGIPYGLIYWGQQSVTSGMASVLFASFPIWVAIEAHFLVPGERLVPVRLAGSVLGFAGIVVVFWERVTAGGHSTLAGMAAIVTSAFISGFGSVIGRRYAKRYHPVVWNSLPMLYGGILLLAVGMLLERDDPAVWSARSVGALLYLAVVGSCVAFVLYFWLLRHLATTTVSLIALLTPITAMSLGWIVLEEGVTQGMLAGTVLIGLGIALATRPATLARRGARLAGDVLAGARETRRRH